MTLFLELLFSAVGGVYAFYGRKTYDASFLVCGVLRLLATVALLAGASWGWAAMLISSIVILWYLPIGTATAGRG